MNRAAEFLEEHSLLPGTIDLRQCSLKMAEHMRAGLEGRMIDMPMIPTYLKGIGSVTPGKNAIVIDAGGTNYRTALAAFSPEGCHITGMKVCKMPGTDKPVTWDEFIAFVADSIMPFTGYADVIGFCFSYNADITPDMDGIVHRIDKEVVITGCEEQRIGRSLIAELEKRGVAGKKVVILNDTVAALLGGAVNLDKDQYSDFIGMICGTGLNTCASVATDKIIKLEDTNNEDPAKALATALETVDLFDGTVVIVWQNNRDLATLTGVSTYLGIWAAALALILGGIVTILVRRRKYSAEQ